MSPARRPSSFLRRSGDLLALSLVSLLLLGSALFLVLSISGGQAALTADRALRPPSAAGQASPLDFSLYRSDVEALGNPFIPSAAGSNTVFISELRVVSVNPDGIPAPIPFAAEVCPFTDHPQPILGEWDSDLGGVPDDVEKRLGTDPQNPDDELADLDDDGFSNLEEYTAGTDPADPESSPSMIGKLRINRILARPFKLRFQGVNELKNGSIFQLNMRSLDRTHFVRMGEAVEGYTLKSYDPEKQELTLEYNGQTTSLVKGRVLSRSERIVQLISLLDESLIGPLQIGDSFEVKGKSYKVVDIRSDAVLIAAARSPNSPERVSRMTPEERSEQELRSMDDALNEPGALF